MDMPMYESRSISSIVEKALKHPQSVNVGLIYEKYPPIWSWNGNEFERDEELKEFFEKITNLMHGNRDVEHLLEHYHSRMENLVNRIGGRSIKLKTNWRFITGLGSPHPTETGSKWDRNLGVPYLPGSSIKGALKAWMRISEKQETFPSLFDEKCVDPVILFDAYPTAKPELDVDILNVHYKEYYDDDKKPPADYLSPNPVFFLTVAPDTEFAFRIAPRDPDCDQDKFEEFLRLTAEELGFGAKTFVGYGQFV